MDNLTSICLKCISTLSSLPRNRSAVSLRDEIRTLKKHINVLESEWLEMAATEYAMDRLYMDRYGGKSLNLTQGWTPALMCKTYREGKSTFINDKEESKFYSYQLEFKQMNSGKPL